MWFSLVRFLKRFLKILLLLLALIAMGWSLAFLLQRPQQPTGSIVLPDGSWAHIEAVTYGTNHLVGPRLAFVADRMPQSIRNLMLRFIGRPAVMRFMTATPTPQLVVWLNRGMVVAPFPPGQGSLTSVLGDTNGFTSGRALNYPARYALEFPGFTVWPRREREITVSVYHYPATGAVRRCGSIVFPNPLYRSYPQWKPEPLPSVKRAGDLEVALEKLSTGHSQLTEYKRLKGGGHEITFGTNRVDGENYTVCFMRLRPLTNTNEVWQVSHVETSDATGNKIGNNMMSGGCVDGHFTYSPALWPGETWKLHCELKRTGGFKPEEQFTFRDVPLGGLNVTNRVARTTNCNGLIVTMEHIVRRAPPVDQLDWSRSEVSQVQFTLSGQTNDLHLDLLSAHTGNGTNLASRSWSGTGTNRTYHFREIPTNATTADFTFTVQRSRWVEFTVKPEVGTARIVRGSSNDSP